MHQSQDCFMVEADPFVLADPQGNASIPIGLMGLFIRFLDELLAGRISIWMLQPMHTGIIAGSRNTKEITHCLHQVLFPLVVEDPILRFASAAFRNSV